MDTFASSSSSSSSYDNFSNVAFNISTKATTSTIPFWIRIVTLTCMIVIDISAFFGNILVICAFFRTRRLQTVTNYFIASLAFADALVAIFVLPLSIYYYQRDRSWKLGLILCDLWVSSDVLLCTSSILNLTCISVDRYMAITKPLTYTAYRSKFLARVMILLVWIFSVVITCPPIFGWRDKNRRQTVEQHYKCDLNTARGYVVYSALGSFYIPGVVMIFVYIRIFMVVYDRESLIKNFRDNNQASTLSIKSNTTSCVNHTQISNNKKQDKNCSIWCCFCCRKTSQNQTSSTVSPPHYSYNHCPSVEQKQNGYLVYRFTSNNNNNNNSNNNNNNNNTNNNNNQTINSNMNINSPLDTRRSSSKVSICSRSCKTSTKKLSNISDDIYQYRCSYLTHIPSEYPFIEDDSPCVELKTLENTLSPLIKRRSRSFEQSTISRIRDLNTELSHSRQLKAAAAAAAATSTMTTNPKDTIEQENENENLIARNEENGDGGDDDDDDDDKLFPSINTKLHQTSQSLNELTQLTIKQNRHLYKKNTVHHITPLPLRTRATTNPTLMQNISSNNVTHPSLNRQKQCLPEPTRINRRVKSSRVLQTSTSTFSIETIKQQHRIANSTPLQSSKSLSIIHRCFSRNENLNETNINQKCSWYRRCCCCCHLPSTSSRNSYSSKPKAMFSSTPSHSLTNEDDDDEKLSSNDTANRTPLYTPAQSSNLTCRSIRSTGTPGDVHRRERIRFMKEQKTAKTLAVVVGGFILFWLPFFIMYVIPPEKHLLNDQTVTLITWLGYFNSVINPFIYAYCSKQFRMAFWNITFGVFVKKSSGLLPISNKNKQLYQSTINA